MTLNNDDPSHGWRTLWVHGISKQRLLNEDVSILRRVFIPVVIDVIV